MKFTSIVAFAAVTAMCNAKVITEFGIERVRHTQRRLERIYGPGLLGLRDEKTGKVQHHRFAWARTIPKQQWEEIGGIKFDADVAMSMVFGLTKGLQY
jgi:hypothetical protein